MKLLTTSQNGLWTKAALGLCLLAGAWAGSGATPARAADAVTIGVLDEAKLGKGYVKYSAELDTLNKRAATFDAQLDAREVLDEAQGKRFDELIAKPTRTPAEETEFQNLIAVGASRRKDRDALIGKAERTAEEEARLKGTQDNMKANANAVRRLEDDLFQDLKSSENATNQKYIDMANEMVKKLAVEKKLTLVLRKDAVVWAVPSVDITDEVLSRLNK
jgi:Skp family chaperone for outer membrane proteins